MRKEIDITGVQFGRFTAVREVFRDAKHRYWLCECQCVDKNTRTVTMNSLRRGLTQSCGCLAKQRTREANTTHGDTKGYTYSSEYQTWQAMKNRCYNANVRSYSDYGGRGITVCAEWRADFAQFLDDMGRRPAGFTLERKDTNGPYASWNCLWASRKEQANNKRTSIYVTVNGVSTNLQAACDMHGLPYHAVYKRIRKGIPESRWLEPLRRRTT